MTQVQPGERRSWRSLRYVAAPELADPLAEVLAAYGQGPVTVGCTGAGRPLVGTWVDRSPEGMARRERIDAAVRLLRRVAPVREAFDKGSYGAAALRAGPFVINPPPGLALGAGEIVVRLASRGAFGTGWHPSTRLCLEALPGAVKPGAMVLDVGCGSGVLSVAAALLGAAEVVGVDTSPGAVVEAMEATWANGVQERVQCMVGALPVAGLSGFDVAVANITARVVGRLAPHLRGALAPGGLMIAAGFLERQRAWLASRVEEAGFQIVGGASSREWGVLEARAK